MGLTPADISSSRAMLQRGDEIRQAQERHVEAARLRDTFAAAALTGLLAAPTDKDRSWEYWARLAYEAADAMLRERAKSYEKSDGKRGDSHMQSATTPRDKEQSTEGLSQKPSRSGKNDAESVPEAVKCAGRECRERESSVPLGSNTAPANAQKPFAWAADIPGKFVGAPTVLFGYTENLVRSIAAAGGDLVQPFPLYRSPQAFASTHEPHTTPGECTSQVGCTLTDAEREAIEAAVSFFSRGYGTTADALRGLLARTSPDRMSKQTKND